MKDFYENILSQNAKEKTPLEKVILWECSQAEDFDRLHEIRIRQMLEDIRQRKVQAEACDGCDWIVATFECMMERALKYGEPMAEEDMLALPPQELYLRRTAQRNLPAAKTYECRKAGMACQDQQAERQLLCLYERLIGRIDWVADQDASHVKTMQLLLGTPYRVFQKKLTDGTQYRYYYKTRLLGTATTWKNPELPTKICCEDHEFTSSFDPQTTLVPGIFRDIASARFSARLVWNDLGYHELQICRDADPISLQIFRDGDIYRFYEGYQCIGETVSFPGRQQLSDWELGWAMVFSQALPEELQVLLMSFPILSIGL